MATHYLMYKIPDKVNDANYYAGIVNTNNSLSSPTWCPYNSTNQNFRMASSSYVPTVAAGDTLYIYISKWNFENTFSSLGYTVGNLKGIAASASSTLQFWSGSVTATRIDTRSGYTDSNTTLHTTSWNGSKYTLWLTYVVPTGASGYYSAYHFSDGNYSGNPPWRARSAASWYVTPPVTVVSPTVNNTQTFATTASNQISHSISLSSAGSGGTLNYGYTRSSARNVNDPSSSYSSVTNWQSSPTFTLDRGYYYYFWARRDSTNYDKSDSSIQVGYLDPEFAVTVTDTTIGPTVTSVSVPLSNVDTNYTAFTLATSSSTLNRNTTEVYTSTVTDARTETNFGSSNTIDFTQPSVPTQGNSTTYYLWASRTYESGGNGGIGDPGWYYSGNSVVVTRQTSGSGGSSISDPPASTYGLEIRNGSNKVILSPSVRYTNSIGTGGVNTISVTRGSTGSFTVSGLGTTSEAMVWTTARTGIDYSISRNTSTGQITITNNYDGTSTSDTFNYIVVRYG